METWATVIGAAGVVIAALALLDRRADRREKRKIQEEDKKEQQRHTDHQELVQAIKDVHRAFHDHVAANSVEHAQIRAQHVELKTEQRYQEHRLNAAEKEVSKLRERVA